MCSLEVPDIPSAIASQYSTDDLQVLLVNTHDDVDTAYDFLQSVEVALPTLLEGQEIYESYPRGNGVYAPFPLQVVIDKEGIIRYIAYQYDAEAVRAAIDEALEE